MKKRGGGREGGQALIDLAAGPDQPVAAGSHAHPSRFALNARYRSIKRTAISAGDVRSGDLTSEGARARSAGGYKLALALFFLLFFPLFFTFRLPVSGVALVVFLGHAGHQAASSHSWSLHCTLVMVRKRAFRLLQNNFCFHLRAHYLPFFIDCTGFDWCFEEENILLTHSAH
jgi:hypothetical protein